MQTDVKAAKLSQSGWFLANGQTARARLKQLTYVPNGSQSGSIKLFDTLVVPTTATYSRSGYTVTVTSTGHGLSTGDLIGISYNASSGAAATDGNYAITRVDANTFTLTDINTGTVGGSPPNCYYVVSYPTGVTANTYPQKYVAAFDTFAAQTSAQQVLMPGEGILIQNGLYALMTNTTSASICYG